MVMLVGSSSTGKTRACWEAVQRLPAGWRLWHPIDPDRPQAALAELKQVGPRTVVWLNEAQFYLMPEREGLGERIAAGLRTLLNDLAGARCWCWAPSGPSTTCVPDGGAGPRAPGRA